MARVSTKAKILAMARTKVLHDVVSELVSAFGADDSSDVLKRGILDEQIISEINFHYLDRSGERVARIAIAIDWELHRVRASSEKGATIEISQDASMSVSEQISQFLPRIMQHAEIMRKEFCVSKIRVGYRYVPEIWNNPKARSEANHRLGAHLEDLGWSSNSNSKVHDELAKFIEYSPEKLKELKITVRQKKTD